MIRVADIALGEKIFEYVDPDGAIPVDFPPILIKIVPIMSENDSQLQVSLSAVP
jgi:hypothetical protein